VRKFLLIICATFFLAPLAVGQFTIVTGTVKDVNGVAYAGGTISASLVVPGNCNPTINGVSFTGSMSPIGLDSTGSFTARLGDNNVINCGGTGTTQWRFLVNNTGAPPPLGTGPQTCTATLTITGASQSVSASFSACPALGNSGGGISSPNTQVVLQLAQSCGSQVNCFTVNANEIQLTDVSTTLNSPIITSTAQAAFKSSDVGKTIIGMTACGLMGVASVSQIIGTTSSNPTIISVQSALQATVSVNASATATNACVDYGNLDDAGAALVDTALTTIKTCPIISLPAGRLMFASGHFTFVVPACNKTPQTLSVTPGASPLLTIAGQGAGVTTIHLLPAFNFASCTGGSTAISCFGGQLMTSVRDLEFTGDGISYASGGPTGNGVIVVELQCGLLLNVTGQPWGYAAGSTHPLYGIVSTCPSTNSTDIIINYVEDGLGSIGMATNPLSGNGNFSASTLFLSDNCTYPLLMTAGHGVIQGGSNLIGQNICGVSTKPVIEINGSGITLDAQIASLYTASAGQHGIQIDGASVVNLLPRTLFTNIAGAGITGIVLNNAGAILNLQGTAWQMGAGTLCGGSGGHIFDQGGNSFVGSTCSTFTISPVASSMANSVAVASRNTTQAATNLLGWVDNTATVHTVTMYPGPLTIRLNASQSAVGSGGTCSTNTTVVWTANWTDRTATAQSVTLGTQTITGAGTVGGSPLNVSQPIDVNSGSVVTFTATETNGNCTTAPSYSATVSLQ
jgi:hypothetical protein